MFTNKKTLFFAATSLALVMAANLGAGERTSEETLAGISREQAQQVAMRQVENGKVIDARFHDRWFKNDDYEFVIVDDATRYIVRIDAKTGNTIKTKKKAIFMDHLTDDERQNLPANYVTPHRLRDIAMKRAPAALIVKMDRYMEYGFHDIKDERVIYEVAMQGNDVRIELTVDAITGDVVSYEEKRLPDWQLGKKWFAISKKHFE